MKICIGADICPTAKSEEKFIQGDARYLFTDVLDIVNDSDRFVINLECALTDTDGRIKKCGPHLKASPKCINGLKNLKITDVALSNNHVYDFGIQGLKDTMNVLDGAGIGYMGIGENDTDSRKPYYIRQDGKTIGFINVCEHEYSYALENRMGCNPIEPCLTMADIREAKKNADFVVVLYHGGKEHSGYPSPRLRNLCREMVNNGANAVITQHSHCIGCYEEYNGGHIVYGQGNLHFAYTLDIDSWFTGMLIRLDISDEMKINFFPTKMEGAQIKLAKGKEYDDIMSVFKERNQSLITGEWKKGWLEFCDRVKVEYDCEYANYENEFALDPTERRRKIFSHFLDCEAHTDVLREIFKTWHRED